MELRQLEYFAAVARHRHFTRAAEELYVTQSALSQQVRRLEAELGLQLLVRGSRGVELTPAGTDLLARAETILAELARARSDMDAHVGVERGLVRVVASPADAQRLPEALVAFHREHPGIRVALRHGSAREVEELVVTGSADLGVAAIAGGETLSDEPLIVALPPGDPLAGAGGVELWDLRDRPLILAERGSALRETVYSACEAAGFGPVPPFEVGDPRTVRLLVSAGLGVALVPESWVDARNGTEPFPARAGKGSVPEVAVVPVAGRPPRHRVALVAAAELTPAAALARDWLLR